MFYEATISLYPGCLALVADKLTGSVRQSALTDAEVLPSSSGRKLRIVNLFRKLPK